MNEENIEEIYPNCGKIVAMVTYQNRVVIATEKMVFQSFDGVEFTPVKFVPVSDLQGE